MIKYRRFYSTGPYGNVGARTYCGPIKNFFKNVLYWFKG